MALLLKRIFETYKWVKDDLDDPRTSDWFLVKSPVTVAFIMITYLILALEVLPKFMQNRKAFDLRKVLVAYNLVQIGLSGYIVIKAFSSVRKLNIFCAPVDYSYSDDGMNFAHLAWIYYMTKIGDLLDTIFFALRKRFNQASFLHLYHHFGMLFMSWVGVKYLAGGESVFLGYINSFVHVIMYSYYLYCAWKPENRNVIKSWKKCVTQLQLVQFVILVAIYSPKMFNDCPFPKVPLIFLVLQNIVMIFMFGDFYYKAYIRGNKETNKKLGVEPIKKLQ